jgi:GntR family histidine utilization transcriptional repressor
MNQPSHNLDTLPRDSTQPLYQQIKDSILERIRSGVWQPGARLPSENALVTELGVSRMTISRALRELSQAGQLRRVHGIGTFVAVPPRHASLIELRNIADEIRGRGMTHRAEVLEHRERRASPALAASLELAPGAPVFHALLVHYQNAQPLQLETRWVNPAMAPDFLHADLTAMTPTRYLLGLFRPDEMEHRVRAVLPDPDECARLRIGPEEPCLQLQRRTWKNGCVVTFVTLLHPGSRYELGARYNTDSYRKSLPQQDRTT